MFWSTCGTSTPPPHAVSLKCAHVPVQVTEKDEEVLEYLVDVRSRELDGEDECGFEITFEFAENPFFENSTLVGPLPLLTPKPCHAWGLFAMRPVLLHMLADH